MKTTTLLLLLITFCTVVVIGPRSFGNESEARVLPFGTGTPGGRGGKILRVTNLESEGPGSLRAAVHAEGPRIIVFEVGGVIDVKKKHLVVSNPFVTIAGQTAPFPGITIIKGCMLVKTHDVILQHIAVRPGDAGEPKRSGWESDAISTFAHGEVEGGVYNIVIDHCSGTWATDENMSVSGPRNARENQTSHDVTFSNCIIAEGLQNSTHKKGRHSRGTLIMDGCSRIALINNLFAHNNKRHPLFKGGSSGVVVNNLMVNPGRQCILMTESGHGKRLGEPIVSIVGNIMIPGKNTKTGFIEGPGKVYARDNAILKSGQEIVPVDDRGEERHLWPEGLKVLPAKEVREHVLTHAGMRPAERDSIDERIIVQCREGRGRIIDSQNDVGGYPSYQMTRRTLQIPSKNVDAWLREMAVEVEKGLDTQQQ